ncbi:hypothetical protein [Streptomyces albospinus]
MLGHSSIAITADTYTSLLPETDRAIAEAAARLVPRARRTEQSAENDADLEADEESGAEGEESGAEAVPDGAGKSAAEPGPGTPSAHAPRTETAPDGESEAE